MAINDVSKYLKFANVQMAAEALYGLTPSNAGLASELQAYTTNVPRVELFCAALT